MWLEEAKTWKPSLMEKRIPNSVLNPSKRQSINDGLYLHGNWKGCIKCEQQPRNYC